VTGASGGSGSGSGSGSANQDCGTGQQCNYGTRYREAVETVGRVAPSPQGAEVGAGEWRAHRPVLVGEEVQRNEWKEV
jgi:hypothetical protein